MAKGVGALYRADMYDTYQTRWYRRLTLVLELIISGQAFFIFIET
ncbi:hypothetical protein [Bacillus sp. FJAT-49711]|nr:hypothetical protein [Bacillus sp. FJAT-49711]